MKRKLPAFLLMVALLCTLLWGITITASAESLYIRKVVSVVYDDSSSMGNEHHTDVKSYIYASYAMQAFCGMLNSEDQLYITYMSDVDEKKDSDQQTFVPPQVDLSAAGIQSSVDAIRNHTEYCSYTPYQAVDVAYNKLKDVQDDNPNTQYWLVVMTDGVFNRPQGSNYHNQAKLNEYCEGYVSQTMPNGSHPQVIFLSIGDSVTSPTQNEDAGIYTYRASDSDDIIDTMSSMADRISGRTRLPSTAVQQIDSHTVRVSSDIPLLNIAALSQSSAAKVVQATYTGGSSIPVSRQVSLSHSGDQKLVGSACLIGDSQTPIRSGSYDIRFDQEVNLSDVVILFEPALEIRMSVTLNGIEVSDHRKLQEACAGDIIGLSCKIYEMGTDTVVPPSLLGDDTTYSLTIREKGQTVKQTSDSGMTLASHTLRQTPTELTATLTIDGFVPIVYSLSFTPQAAPPKVNYTIQTSFGGSAQSMPIGQAANNRDLSVCFTVYADGVAMTDPMKVKALMPQISFSPAGNGGTVEYAANGRIVVTPNRATAPQGEEGDFPVTVTCTIKDGTTATKSYTVTQPAPVYTVSAAFGSGTQSVKLNEIGQNRDMTICFTVYKNGEALTDPEMVKALAPQIGFSPAGNAGTVDYTADGRIVVTPHTAKAPAQASGSFAVTVSCTLQGGAQAEKDYTVRIPAYTVEAALGSEQSSIRPEEIAGNTALTVVFTVYEDGEAITDPEKVKALAPQIGFSPTGNAGTVDYTADGRIVVTPNSVSVPSQTGGSFDVQVRCTLQDGESATASYTVLLPTYTVGAAFGSDQHSVKLDEIASNKDMTICFTVYEDGVAITDPEKVKALAPQISFSPAGNAGAITYAPDGRIVVTPNTAAGAPASGSMDVTVTCLLGDGIEAKETYSVLVSTYAIVVIPATGSVEKIDFFGNEIGVSFYITKDGVRLNKQAVESGISISLNEQQAALLTRVTVAEDGTITVVPYSDQPFEPFWLFRWWPYWFNLSVADVEVTLSHPYGTAAGTVPVTPASLVYQLLNVFLPLLTLLVIIVAIAAYVIAQITRPRFAKTAVLYVGTLTRMQGRTGHYISLTKHSLKRYNHAKLWPILWPLADITASLGGISVVAKKHEKIAYCGSSLVLRFSEGVESNDTTVIVGTPNDIVEYNQTFARDLHIKEIQPQQTTAVKPHSELRASSTNYYCLPDEDFADVDAGRIKVIRSATVFCYVK